MFSPLTSPFIRIVSNIPSESSSFGSSVQDSPQDGPSYRCHDDGPQSLTLTTDATLCHHGTGSLPSHCDMPNELLDAIFVYADRQALATIARCSHLFHDISVRHLYRHIPSLTLSRTVKCLRTLSKDTDHARKLASHVRIFDMGDMDSLNADRTRSLLGPFYRILRLALRNMHNLAELSFLLFGPTAGLLLGTTFTLTRLCAGCDFDETFGLFLETQRSLRIAFFCGPFTRGTNLSKNSLPALSRVSASPLILAAIVPGRPVKEVELCLVHPFLFNEEVLSVTIRILSYSKGPLSSLQIISHLTETPETVLGALETIPANLRSLDALALHAVSGSITNDFLTGLPPILSGFSCLKSLVLLSKNQYDALHDHMITRNLPASCNAACASLECVSFPNATYIRHRKYNWINVQDLERMLMEREQVLLQREREVKEREAALNKEQSMLEERERRLAEQVLELGVELEGIHMNDGPE